MIQQLREQAGKVYLPKDTGQIKNKEVILALRHGGVASPFAVPVASGSNAIVAAKRDNSRSRAKKAQ